LRLSWGTAFMLIVAPTLDSSFKAEAFIIFLFKVFFISLIAIVRDHTMRDESLSHVNEGVLGIVVLDT
jgi:hypothetical protein